MNYSNFDNEIQFVTKNIEDLDKVKTLVKPVIEDLFQVCGKKALIDLYLHKESTKDKFTTISIYVDIKGESFFAKKRGKYIYPTLMKVKKIILKKYKGHQKKKNRRWASIKEKRWSLVGASAT